MAKKRKTKARKVTRKAGGRKRPAPARRKVAKRKAARKPVRKAKPAKRPAAVASKRAPSAPRPMSPPGPAVVPIEPRPTPFPSANPMGGAYGDKSDKND